MVDLLDEFLDLTPAARAKWDQLSPFHKRLMSFMFFASVLRRRAGLIKIGPSFTAGGRQYTRCTVDIIVGQLGFAMAGNTFVVLDFELDKRLDGADRPLPPS